MARSRFHAPSSLRPRRKLGGAIQPCPGPQLDCFVAPLLAMTEMGLATPANPPLRSRVNPPWKEETRMAMPPLPSHEMLDGPARAPARAMLRAAGYDDEAL